MDINKSLIIENVQMYAFQETRVFVMNQLKQFESGSNPM